MITKELVNRVVIHRQSLHFQIENKIIAHDAGQLMKNGHFAPFFIIDYEINWQHWHFTKKPHHTYLTGS